MGSLLSPCILGHEEIEAITGRIDRIRGLEPTKGVARIHGVWGTGPKPKSRRPLGDIHRPTTLSTMTAVKINARYSNE